MLRGPKGKILLPSALLLGVLLYCGVVNAQSDSGSSKLDAQGGFKLRSRRENLYLGRVTSLADSGPGTLRECLVGSVPRVCIFEVGGIIDLKSDLTISKGRITIAGQTAPSPGIVLRGATLSIESSDVVVENISVWVGDSPHGPSAAYRDGVRIGSEKAKVRRVFLDHLSVLWGLDENVSVLGESSDITIQNSLIAEGLENSIHPKGPHSKGVLISPNSKRVSLIRNIIAFHGERLPLIQDGSSVFMLNNVVYGWGGPSRSSIIDISTNKSHKGVRLDLIGNVFLPAPWSTSYPSVFAKPPSLLSRIYLRDNLGPTRSSSEQDEWKLVDLPQVPLRSNLPTFTNVSETVLTSGDVERELLNIVGSRPFKRSAPDIRILASVAGRAGEIKDCISKCTRNVGGWPRIGSSTRPKRKMVSFKNLSSTRFLRALRRYLREARQNLPVVRNGRFG